MKLPHEHYQDADQLLAEIENDPYLAPEAAQEMLGRAHVHALLAQCNLRGARTTAPFLEMATPVWPTGDRL